MRQFESKKMQPAVLPEKAAQELQGRHMNYWKAAAVLFALIIYTFIVSIITIHIMPAKESKVYYIAQYTEEAMPPALKAGKDFKTIPQKKEREKK
jgi:hypothetical protein